tara:strand:+ start:74226 stop:74717 length:492 start_codon:yes stop_codon:yes gene_type:complete
MIKNIVISNEYTEIISAPSSQKYANLGIYFCNTTTEGETIDLFVAQAIGFNPADLSPWAADGGNGGVYGIDDRVRHDSKAWQAISESSPADVPGSAPAVWSDVTIRKDVDPGNQSKVVSELYIPPGQTFMFGGEKFLLNHNESIGASSQVGGRVTATATFTDF